MSEQEKNPIEKLKGKFLKDISKKVEVKNTTMKVTMGDDKFEGQKGIFMMKTDEGYVIGICGEYEEMTEAVTFNVRLREALADEDEKAFNENPEMVEELIEAMGDVFGGLQMGMGELGKTFGENDNQDDLFPDLGIGGN